MSTNIDVYPASPVMPLVEETRARTQRLFQELLDRHRVGSVVEVKAFHPSDDGSIRYVEPDLRWEPEMGLGFGYWINGTWDSSSWPSCLRREEDDLVEQSDLASDERPYGYSPEFLGRWYVLAELQVALPAEKLAAIDSADHYWFEYRNAGGPAVASTGYGLVAAALAEATDGVIASFDCAFDESHNGESAAEFLAWWGDRQIDFYGVESFRSMRRA